MKHFTYLVALVLLCIQNVCLGIPIGTSKDKQMIYSYKAYSETASNAHNDTIGRWSIEGDLIVQPNIKYIVFQLNNIKTSLFNGDIENVTLSTFEDIPKEAEILKQPFVLNTQSYTLHVAENEPLWSLNFKRSIASNVREIEKGVHYEKSVFGNCQTNTEWKGNGIISKTISHESCKGVPFEHKTNVRPAPGREVYNPLKIETTYESIINDPKPTNYRVNSLITYKPMPSEHYNLFIYQKQEMNFVNKSTDFERINTKSLTEEKKIFFEYGERTTQGRHKYETDAKVLTEQYLNSYDKFLKQFEKRPLENRRSTEDPIEDMYQALYNIRDTEGMNYLREKIEDKANWKLYSSFISLIPYVGTNTAVNHIYNGIIKADLEDIPTYAIRLLAIFPQYIRNPTNELVHSLEGMIDIENVKSDLAKSGRILSFASVVARGHEKKYLAEVTFEKYSKIYFEKLLNSETYEYKMMYLLGLVNMAEGLSTDIMTSIITNTSLPDNIRSLALAGFKTALSHGNTNELFNTFWPTVLNKDENFDVRVEALDLLLSLELNQDQFNVILKKFTKYQANEIHDKHLANYFRSSLESLQNNTAYKFPLGDLATAAIENEHFETIIRPWTTGNYRLSFSDKEPNIGASYHARFIANPILNTPSTIQLSYNDFAWSFDMGTYSIYFKVQGVIEQLFKKDLFRNIRSDTPIPELVKLIKDFKFEMKKEQLDFHVEIVVFVNDKAVFTTFFDQTNYNKKLQNLADIFEEILKSVFTISYPVMDYTQMPSSLGTPLNIYNDKQEINSFSHINNDLNYRSSWNYQIWFESYDPILDTTVSSYKYYGDEKSIDTKISVNPKRLAAVWANKNDSVNWAWDKIFGTTVDDPEILHQFCPSCEENAEMPKLYFMDSTKNMDMWGVNFNGTSDMFLEGNDRKDEEDGEDFYSDFRNIHLSNSYAIPHAKPLIATIHFFKYWYYLKPEVKRALFRNYPVHENGTMTRINIDFDTSTFTKTADPFQDSAVNASVHIVTKALHESISDDENYLTNWSLQYDFISTHNHTDENGEHKVKNSGNLYHSYEKANESLLQICGSRNELLPPARNDKLSILPPEDATAVNYIRYDQSDNETDWNFHECGDNHTITFTEEYTTNIDNIKKVKESENYKKCLEDSKDFKYTPPTYSCLSTFMALSQYDKYTIHGKIKNVPKLDETDLDDHAIFIADRIDENKVKYKFLLTPFGIGSETQKYFERIMYNTLKLKDPVADVYGDYNIVSGFKRPCVISAKNIRSFTGRNIDNKENTEQVGFVECFEKGRRGLTFNKISPTHVGFKFWSYDNVVEATVKGNKLKVTLNGENLEASHIGSDEQRLSVHLDEDVIYVSDDKINIYYNTEYIFIKAFSVYNDIICGVCNQH